MDNLTIAIIAAVVSAVAKFLLTKASTIAKVVSGSRSIRWTARKFRNLRDGYGVKRTRKVVRNWFGTDGGIRRLSIEDYERATRTRERGKPAVQLFSFINLKQPSFAPKLDDHYIAAAIENLCKKGTLAKISEAQLGGGYSHTRGQPAEPNKGVGMLGQWGGAKVYHKRLLASVNVRTSCSGEVSQRQAGSRLGG